MYVVNFVGAELSPEQVQAHVVYEQSNMQPAESPGDNTT